MECRWESCESARARYPRILYATVGVYPADTANSVQQIKTAHATARLGFAVDFVTRTAGKQVPPLSRILTYYGLSPEPNFHHFPVFASRGRWRYRSFMLRAVPFCSRWILQQRPFVVWTREPNFILALMPVARLKGAKLVFEAHDPADMPNRGHTTRRRLLYRLAFRLADFVITVTHQGKNRMVAQGVQGEKIIVAPDAADPIDCLPARSQLCPPLKLLYMGSLRKDRGCLTFVQSLIYLPASLDYKVCIVGGQPCEVDELKAAVGDIGVFNRVELTGHVPHSDVAGLLGTADILVLPMGHSLVADCYASPMKLFEYMSAGRPIVACDVPTLHEVVDESMVYFCEPDDPQSMAEAIIATVRNWDEALAKAARARQHFLERYTFEHRARYILEAIGVIPPR